MSRMITNRQPIFKNIKCCVFDFDGTLVDTMGGFGEVAAHVMTKYFDIEYEEAKAAYFFTSGNPFNQQLEELFPNNPNNIIAVKEFEENKLKDFYNTYFPLTSRITLNTLGKKGIKVIVSSNNSQKNIDKFLTLQRVNFDYVLGYKKDFEKGKDHFDYIKNKLNINPNEIVFIGDSLKDAEKANENKVNFLGKIGTFKKEDFEKKYSGIQTISDLTELIEIIE